MKIRIGSRESRLAVIQSEMVQEYLMSHVPDAEVSLVTMKTTGDKILDRPLENVGGKGLFVKELDRALLEDKTDLSVHSLKDIPMEVPEELPLVAYSKREDERDVLVLPKGQDTIDFAKPIGTSSLRRILQLQKLYPNARFESVRGNLVTRLKKLDEGQYGALILAAAGMKRMGYEKRISRYFSTEEVIPAAGQGILAVQGKKGRDYSYLQEFDCQMSRSAALAERAFVRTLNGGCSSPVAAHAKIDGNILKLRGLFYLDDEEGIRIDEIEGNIQDAEQLGKKLALRFLSKTESPSEVGTEKSEETQAAKMGKVYLVGAGPGDAGLLTIKGKRVLEEAQVVVYDRLVGDSILAMIPKSARMIDVGKRAGHHTMPQEEINLCLLGEAKKGLRVVRLKGGDPFLFGRGGEELELLSENGVPYEVIPGVTSPIAVPAYNGIPVTHRDYCSSVHIITGHQKNGEPLQIAFDALVRTKGTLVFLMGITALDGIMKGLLDAGMDPHMPAAVLQKGTTARQKRIVAEIGTLSEEVRKIGVVTPAIIVVGKVCALADQFAWYEKLPLSGYKIVVTRPAERSGKMSDLLRRMGAEVLELPAIVTEPISDNCTLQEAIKEICRYQWIAFTSPYGVRVFFDALLQEKKDLRSLSGCLIAAIGEGTKKELQNRGILPDLVPKTYDGESLGRALAWKMKEGDRILLPRASMGGTEILEELAKVPGIVIDDVPIYETSYETSGIGIEQKLCREEEIDLVVFTSASTVRGFVQAVGTTDLSHLKAACIGHKTAEAASEYGMKIYIAREATLESLADLAVQIKTEQQEKE